MELYQYFLEKVYATDVTQAEEILPEHIKFSNSGIKLSIEIIHSGNIHDVKIMVLNQIDRTEGEIMIIRVISVSVFKVTSADSLFKRGNDTLLPLLMEFTMAAQAHNIGMMRLKMVGYSLLENTPITTMPKFTMETQIRLQIEGFYLS